MNRHHDTVPHRVSQQTLLPARKIQEDAAAALNSIGCAKQCLESRALSANHLLTDFQDRALGNRLNRMSLNARTSLSEQGVNVLFVAFGLQTSVAFGELGLNVDFEIHNPSEALIAHDLVEK